MFSTFQRAFTSAAARSPASRSFSYYRHLQLERHLFCELFSGSVRQHKSFHRRTRAYSKATMTSTLPELPKLPGTDPERCVLDTFRVAAAVHLSKALDIPVETAFTGVDLGKLKNDFTVAIPRFRLKGKPADLVAKVVNAVSSNTLWPRSLCD